MSIDSELNKELSALLKSSNQDFTKLNTSLESESGSSGDSVSNKNSKMKPKQVKPAKTKGKTESIAGAGVKNGKDLLGKLKAGLGEGIDTGDERNAENGSVGGLNGLLDKAKSKATNLAKDTLNAQVEAGKSAKQNITKADGSNVADTLVEVIEQCLKWVSDIVLLPYLFYKVSIYAAIEKINQNIIDLKFLRIVAAIAAGTVCLSEILMGRYRFWIAGIVIAAQVVLEYYLGRKDEK